jgi:cob(I)alamin adenosyltransferase
MPRITKVVTKTGDDGTTALGSGCRVSKASPRIAACGAIDELNAQLGVVLAAGVPDELAGQLRRIQNELFHAGAELTIPDADRARHPGPRIEARHVAALDELIGRLNAQLPPLGNFVLPGGTPAAAGLHVARTVCRRAEREVVALAEREPVGQDLRVYLNRLSDALFVLARCANKLAGVAEPLWDSHA